MAAELCDRTSLVMDYANLTVQARAVLILMACSCCRCRGCLVAVGAAADAAAAAATDDQATMLWVSSTQEEFASLSADVARIEEFGPLSEEDEPSRGVSGKGGGHGCTGSTGSSSSKGGPVPSTSSRWRPTAKSRFDPYGRW